MTQTQLSHWDITRKRDGDPLSLALQTAHLPEGRCRDVPSCGTRTCMHLMAMPMPLEIGTLGRINRLLAPKTNVLPQKRIASLSKKHMVRPCGCPKHFRLSIPEGVFSLPTSLARTLYEDSSATPRRVAEILGELLMRTSATPRRVAEVLGELLVRTSHEGHHLVPTTPSSLSSMVIQSEPALALFLAGFVTIQREYM
jgi:hypothetical protein